MSALSSLAQTPCVGGTVDVNGIQYPCDQITLLAHVDRDALPSGSGCNDIWGWTDPGSGREFVILGQRTGTSFVEITDPLNPIVLGILPSGTAANSWRDMKTFGNYAFIVSEHPNQGMQVFDLTQLLTVSNPVVSFSHNLRHGFDGSTGSAHNIVGLEKTEYMIMVGGSDCVGFDFVDVSDPLNPVNLNCFQPAAAGYCHDAICFEYQGADTEHIGKQICIGSNESVQVILDVSDPMVVEELGRSGYSGREYTHQGWITEDQKFLLFNDELDEIRNQTTTRTHIMDIQDLDNPFYVGFYDHGTNSADHNCFVKGNYLYAANYLSGFRMLKLIDPGSANLSTVGYFDTDPGSDARSTSGNWGVYPYFESGTVAISHMQNGLYLLRPEIPHFDLDVAKETTVIQQGNTASIPIDLTAYYGFSSSVSLSIVNPSSDFTASLSSSSAPANGSINLMISDTDCLSGAYSIEIQASGAGEQASTVIGVKFDSPFSETESISDQTLETPAEYQATESVILDNVIIDGIDLQIRAPRLETRNTITIRNGGNILYTAQNPCVE